MTPEVREVTDAELDDDHGDQHSHRPRIPFTVMQDGFDRKRNERLAGEHDGEAKRNN